MGFVVREMDNHSDSFKQFLSRAVRGRVLDGHELSGEELSKKVDEIFVAFVSVVSFGLTKAITSAVGLAQLRPTYDDVLALLPKTEAVKLIDASVSLDHGTEFPKTQISTLCDETKEKWFAHSILRSLVAYHFSMFHVERKTAVSVGAKLGINMQDYSIVSKLAGKT